MSGGPNGRTPGERLKQLERSRYSATGAEPLVQSKCPMHPTKRVWTDPVEAIREAEARSEAAKMPISAYKCEGCGHMHLCKTANVRKGSEVTRPEPRNFEVFVKPVPGNKAARQKVLRIFLDGKIKVSTDEVITELGGISRHTASTLMREAGWTIPRGPGARWTRVKPVDVPAEATITPLAVVKADAFADSERKELEASISRHPASQLNPWADFDKIDTLRHIPLGDIIDMLRATGAELRIQHRKAR